MDIGRNRGRDQRGQDEGLPREQQVPHRAFSPIRNDNILYDDILVTTFVMTTLAENENHSRKLHDSRKWQHSE
jgi:hypothetical protein